MSEKCRSRRCEKYGACGDVLHLIAVHEKLALERAILFSGENRRCKLRIFRRLAMQAVSITSLHLLFLAETVPWFPLGVKGALAKTPPSCIGTAFGCANAPAVFDGCFSGITLFGVFLIALTPLPLRCRAYSITEVMPAGSRHTSVFF